MVFKQTSQKFGQWADPKSSGVFGLGFDSEMDLNKVWFCGVLTDFNCDVLVVYYIHYIHTKLYNNDIALYSFLVLQDIYCETFS